MGLVNGSMFCRHAVLHDSLFLILLPTQPYRSAPREKLAFSVQAHVFQIDQQTKKRWLPSSSAAIRVAYYHDPNRKTYRIIAIENSKVKLLQNLGIPAGVCVNCTHYKYNSGLLL